MYYIYIYILHIYSIYIYYVYILYIHRSFTTRVPLTSSQWRRTRKQRKSCRPCQPFCRRRVWRLHRLIFTRCRRAQRHNSEKYSI